MALIVAHAGWDELLVAAVAVGVVLYLRTRSEKKRRLAEQEEERTPAPVEDAR
ncbi:MAG TPA: hypothetical protein VMP42_09795 [Actinomycetota bacterium]|nr:hypothetical protein [Actinomycetota bacterium]